MQSLQGDMDVDEEFDSQQPRWYRLVTAISYMLVSRSELLCYFLMILDMLVYASLLALPLPVFVFLWGMLAVPRPSKTFWVTVITYTEVKYFVILSLSFWVTVITYTEVKYFLILYSLFL